MDEVPEGYKKTEIGILPEDWEVVPIVDCCMFERGTEPGSKSYNRKGKGILFIRVGNIAKGQQELIYTTSKKVKLCKREDILLALDGSPGAVAKGWEGAYASGIRKVIIKGNWKNKINYQFVYYILQHDIVQKIIKEHTTGVTILHASKSLNYIKIPLPPLEEQRKIAKILDTIRQAIELQDKTIEAWKRIKKSTMAKLFREGLYGEELKETEIGKMPKSWKVVRLGNTNEIKIIMGQSPPGKTYNKEGKGVPFIQGKAEFGDIHPNPVLWTTHPRKIAEKGDILISVRAPVGDVNLCPFKLCIGRGLAAIRIKKGSNLFYFYWFNKIKYQLKNIGKGSTFKSITKNDLEKLLVPLPPLEEQKQIAKILSTIDKKIEIEKRRKEVLQRLFKSMLHLLMTGKIRVKKVEI